MTLTVRSATVTGATTKGSPLTHAELDENWNHVTKAENQRFTPSGSGAVATDVQTKLRATINLKEDFDADDGGVTVNSTAFSNFLTKLAGRRGIIGGGGTFLVDNSTPFALPADCELVIERGTTVKANSDGPIFSTTSKDGITISGAGKFEGTGTTTGSGLLVFTTCDHVKIREIEVTQSNQSAITFRTCTHSSVYFTHLHNNRHYGIDDKSGSYNEFCFNDIYDNGRPSSGDNTSGRGVNLWMSTHCKVAFNDIYDNTEYGIRIYSESGDATGASYNTVCNNNLQDNGDSGTNAIELFVYNDSGLVEKNKIHNNIVVKTTSRGNFAGLQGTDDEFYNNKMIAADSDRSMTAIALAGASRNKIYGNEAYGVSAFVGFSGNSLPEDCEIDDNKAYEVVSFFSSYTGDGHKVRRNLAVHGGSGTTDRGMVINVTNAIDVLDNVLDGFQRCIYITTTAPVATITGNKTRNSTDAGFYAQAVTTQTNLKVQDNDWDSCWPIIFQTMQYNMGSASWPQRTATANTYPTGIGTGNLMNWAEGDRIYNSDPEAGTPISWICDVAGTPGTWVVEAMRPSVNTSGVGNVSTGEDNLQTFSLGANSMSVAGKGVRITAWGTAANNSDAKTLKLYFGSTAISTQSLTTSQASVWRFEALVFSIGTDQQEYVAKFQQEGTAEIHDIDIGSAAENDGAAIVIKCTGEATSNNDIVQEGMLVELL